MQIPCSPARGIAVFLWVASPVTKLLPPRFPALAGTELGCTPPTAQPLDAKSHREACGEKGCARALGEPCGVYTPSCARGLRCIPRAGERTPLHALLHGKGVCRAVGGRKGSRNHTEPEPPADGVLQEGAPCRMHLAAVMLELKAPLYLSGEDIFIPNCDTKGFYRKKQCRASKGQRRGQCWCVDKKGHPLAGSGGSGLGSSGAGGGSD
uniref:Insulin like growth factor binding protein 6 n=1 Tax=Chelonoidis abingdonii TaxID=106734 RepID=A0A8C0GNA7_CHEAB